MKSNSLVYVHPKGLCESEDVGTGTKIWAFAHVMKGARIGKNCNICDAAFIETGAIIGSNVTIKNGVYVWDKVTIGDNVFIGPGTIFTNDLIPRINNKTPRKNFLETIVQNNSTIGANATIKCGITIGASAFVGAGSVVTRNILDFEMVIGNPAQFHSWICYCGSKLNNDYQCICSKQYVFENNQIYLIT